MSDKESHKIFSEFLRNGNHRITPERFEVLDFALEQDGHFSADDLYVAMKTAKSNISRATVYNTLELIANCGLVNKRNFEDGRITYESAFRKQNHDHLICTNCGEIIEFNSPEIERIVEEVCDKFGFDVSSYSFNIFGKCRDEHACDIKHKKSG